MTDNSNKQMHLITERSFQMNQVVCRHCEYILTPSNPGGWDELRQNWTRDFQEWRKADNSCGAKQDD